MPMQMGIFFKWIKQNLRIKVFYGTSLTAVKTRIWSAISVYVPIAIGKKWLNLDKDLYTILQVLGQTLFEIPPLLQVVTESEQKLPEANVDDRLTLFTLYPDSSDGTSVLNRDD